jgi:hypothetical protein
VPGVQSSLAADLADLPALLQATRDYAVTVLAGLDERPVAPTPAPVPAAPLPPRAPGPPVRSPSSSAAGHPASPAAPAPATWAS